MENSSRESMKTDADKQKSFSIIIGEHHSQDVHQIAEFIPSREQYRLKTVSYHFFRSKKALVSFCQQHEIVLDRISETRCTKAPMQAEEKIHISENHRKKRPMRAEEKIAIVSATQLSARQLRFCNEYLRCKNATQAYIAAVPTVKSRPAAAVGGSTLLKQPEVKAYLASKEFHK